MNNKTIKTSKGNIVVNVTQKYSLSSLMILTEEQLKPFFKLFNIDRTLDEGLSDLVKILYENDMMIEEEILKHSSIWALLEKSITNIEKLMSDKGIWFPGMNKYLAIKVLLLCHSLVCSIHTPVPVPNTHTTIVPVPNTHTTIVPVPNTTIVPVPNTTIVPAIGTPVTETKIPKQTEQNTEIRVEPIDTRTRITNGKHYEHMPPRDFNIYTKRANLKTLLLKDHFNQNVMINNFDPAHLEFIYNYYNEHSFNQELSTMLKDKNRKLTFGININSTSKIGEHKYDPSTNTHSIRISSSFICNLFNKNEKTMKTNGIIIGDRLSALINIFEHELVHLYCSLKGYTRKIREGEGKMYYSPHGKLFQEMVFSYFGHTEFRHDLNKGDATDLLSKDDCFVGMNIYFDSKGTKIYGRIDKLNPKTCGVTTESGTGYNVSYPCIKVADREVHVKQKPETDKTKYTVGNVVKFMTKEGLIKGKIVKCNPKRARVECDRGIYDVPYESLIS